MPLRINSQAPRVENTQGKSNFHQWIPEPDAEGDLYGENGERMPYYPARPRQQTSYELSWDQNAWRFSSAGAGARDASMTSPNVPQTRLRHPLVRRSRRTTSAIKKIGAAAIALLAFANTFAQAADDRTRMAREQYACTVIMGLHQPGDLYDTCIRSLDKTWSELDQARLVSTDRTRCAQEGLKPGTPAFAVCVGDAEQSPVDAGSHQAIAAVR